MKPINTDPVFGKFADCLAAEEQMREHYSDAFEVWDPWAAEARDLQPNACSGTSVRAFLMRAATP
jgi:hypothetical protein